MLPTIGDTLERFYTGAHHTEWLGYGELADVDLFVSLRALEERGGAPRPGPGRCAIDGGGFTKGHKNCANCPEALRVWRDELMELPIDPFPGEVWA